MARSRNSKTSTESASQTAKQSVVGKPLDHMEFKYTCDICGAKMNRDLKRHQLKHEEKGRYECPIEGCTETFNQKSNLDTHVNVHTRNRAHKCPESWIDESGQKRPCPARFTDPSVLTRHRKSEHGAVSVGKGRKMPLAEPKFRSSADLERDALEYKTSSENKVDLRTARSQVSEGRAAAQIAEALMAAQALAAASASPPDVSADSSSSSQSSCDSYPAPDDTFPDDFLSCLNAPSTSSDCYNANALPESSYCDFDMSLPASDIQQAISEQAQVQNFVDIVGETNMLLPSQLPTQYFGNPLPPTINFPFVPQAWCAPQQQYQNAPAFNQPFYPGAGMGTDALTQMNMAMAMGLGLDMGPAPQSNVFPFYFPSMPAQQQPLEPVAPWGTFYVDSSASSASSVASTPPPTDDSVFEEFIQRFYP
ncbi:hypothetical protein C8Q73DRAFT_834609 [Cubamyces lactineus]|nr:hypothetical protein C8Q73DRAFT_834609 [Cubamyces lactineus]